MKRGSVLVALLGAAVTMSALLACATHSSSRAPKLYTLDQGIDSADLARYHYLDQGTRLIPAAWLAALEKPDGSGKLVTPEEMRLRGFLTEGVVATPANPYGWPIGMNISRPETTGGIPIAGFTCAMCHTGQIEYRGAAIRIEGGQANIALPDFVNAVIEALTATARDPARLEKFKQDAIAAGYPAERMAADFSAATARFAQLATAPPGGGIVQLPPGHGRLDAVQSIANQVFGTDLGVPANLRNLDGPVSYPFLWDIWHLSWLQYSAFLPPQSTSRNIGETLGTKARTNIVDARGALNPEPERWRTSIQLDNLRWAEKTLAKLKPPVWPEQVLGRIDRTRAARGRQLFGEHCAHCHGIKALPNDLWDVTVIPLTHIGTDPNAASNWSGRTYDGTKIGLGSEVGAYNLSVAINAVRRELYALNNTPVAEQEPDLGLLQAPCGYRARPLVGVWATPPFLHNGSVRTVYDLLSDTRPASFAFGTREYDPNKLGYVDETGPTGMVLDTSVPGNRNTGHWWTDDTTRPGRIGPRLDEDEKYALIEYLKSATYDDYPRETRAEPARMPCQDERDWARAATQRR